MFQPLPSDISEPSNRIYTVAAVKTLPMCWLKFRKEIDFRQNVCYITYNQNDCLVVNVISFALKIQLNRFEYTSF